VKKEEWGAVSTKECGAVRTMPLHFPHLLTRTHRLAPAPAPAQHAQTDRQLGFGMYSTGHELV